ncbi:hypothetical protein [Streptomyces sp. NPDC057682]|uniref:hypothetical protein n=1 Tax=unclassified Streptomyces TaxID=2593676 RepID=UPI003669E73F
MAENVEPNETPEQDAPEVEAHSDAIIGWCGVHQEVAEEPEVVAHVESPIGWCGVHQEVAEEPEVIAHSEEGEDTPWCGVHQEQNL